MAASESKQCMWSMLQLLLVAVTYLVRITCVRGDPQVPCYFIFGDSLYDPGNNNRLLTTAKANYFPYGIDFPNGAATGRFSSKYTSVDYLAMFMKLRSLISPFANKSDTDIMSGINYASGGGGVLIETGLRVGVHDNLPAQIIKHKLIYDAIVLKLGGVAAAQQYLHKCLYHFNIGRMDYFDNYLNPSFNLRSFTDRVIYEYAVQIKALYELGARKFALVGIGPIGCLPSKRNTNGECVEALNAGAALFSEKLRSLVDKLNSEYSGDAAFIFINATAISTQNPGFAAFKNPRDSCCKTVPSTGLCVRNEPPCENRDDYQFWDGLHTSDAARKLYALSEYNSSNPNFAYPMDMNQLVSLPLSPSPPSPAA